MAVQLELLYMTQNVSNGSLLWLTGPGLVVGLVVGPSVGITGLPPSSVVWSERAVHVEKLLKSQNPLHAIKMTAMSKTRTLAVSAYEASLLQAVVVIPASVLVHLHAILLEHFPGVEGRIGLPGSPVEEAQRCLVCPGPAHWKISRTELRLQ